VGVSVEVKGEGEERRGRGRGEHYKLLPSFSFFFSLFLLFSVDTLGANLQGRLLRKLREKYAYVFQNLSEIQSDGLWQLETSALSLTNLRGNLIALAESKTKSEEEMKKKIALAYVDAENLAKEARKETSDQKVKYEEKIASLNKSLTTLQQIVQNMASDTGKVRDGDMSQQLLKLRNLCDEQESTLEELRPLKQEAKTTKVKLMMRENELNKLKEENARQKSDLSKQNKLLKTLIDKRGVVLTDEEYTLMQSIEHSAANAESDPESSSEEEEDLTEKPPTSLLCVLCHGRLDKTINLKKKLLSGPPRLPAQNYRVLLPKIDLHREDPVYTEPTFTSSDEEDCGEEEKKGSGRGNGDDDEDDEDLEEKVPDTGNKKTGLIMQTLESSYMPPVIRSLALSKEWVVNCMRSICNAKVVEESLVSTSFRIESGMGVRRSRFPDFVHSWFEPPEETVKKVRCHAEKCTLSQASKTYKNAVSKDDDAEKELRTLADSHRWALYYGVKMLASQSPPLPEAVLFFSLLDETYPEDFLSFYLFCLSTVKSVCGKVMRKQEGITAWPHPPTNYYELKERMEKAGFKNDGNDSAGTKTNSSAYYNNKNGVIGPPPHTCWIPSELALQISRQICRCALQDELEVTLRAVSACLITAQGRLPYVTSNSIKCIDMHLLVKLFMHTYRAEQALRKGVVRLMFETAAAGRCSDEALLYAQEKGYGRRIRKGGDGSGGAAGASFYSGGSEDDGQNGAEDFELGKGGGDNGLDPMQFRCVMNSFAPGIEPAEISSLFREIWTLNEQKVTSEGFLKAAERNQLFTRCAKFPESLAALSLGGEGEGEGEGEDSGSKDSKEGTSDDPYGGVPYSLSSRHRVGAIVHMRSQLLAPWLDSLSLSLPQGVRCLVSSLRASVSETMNFCADATGTRIDGMAPLGAYRRLLLLCLTIRMLGHETGRRRWPTSTSGELGSCVERELRVLESLLRDFGPCKLSPKLDNFARTYSAFRIQAVWRALLSRRLKGPPLQILKFMRSGYLNNRGDISRRERHLPIPLVMDQVGSVYEQYIKMTGESSRLALGLGRQQSVTTGKAAMAYFLGKYGVPAAGERALHDFFMGVRGGEGYLARLRIFGLFCGMDGVKSATADNVVATGESSEAPEEGKLDPNEWNEELGMANMMRRAEAVSFYLQVVQRIHTEKRKTIKIMKDSGVSYLDAIRRLEKKERKKGGNIFADDYDKYENENENENDYTYDDNKEALRNEVVHKLFPHTPRNLDDNNYTSLGWKEPTSLLRKVCCDVFVGLNGNDMVPPDTVREVVLRISEGIKSAEGGWAGVDSFLWEVMQVWCTIVRLRVSSLRKFFRRSDEEKIREWIGSGHKFSGLCMEEIGCKGKEWMTTLQGRDREEVVEGGWRKAVMGSEKVNFGGLRRAKEALEQGVMEAVTIDLGGATNRTKPLMLHSDSFKRVDRRHREAQQKKKKERESAEAKQREEQMSFAEKARAKQSTMIGKKVEDEVEDDERDESCVFVDWRGGLEELNEAFRGYDGKIREWIAQVEETKSNPEQIQAFKAKFNAFKGNLSRFTEGAKVAALGETEKDVFANDLQMRLHVEKEWSTFRGLLSDLLSMGSEGEGVDGRRVTKEILKDVWVEGERNSFAGKKKLVQWAT